MDKVTPKATDTPALEAARWMLLLEEEPGNPRLRAAFESWRQRSPEHAAAWADMAHIDHLMGGLPAVHAAHWAPKPPTIMPGHCPPARHRHHTAGLLVALAACLSLLLAIPTVRLWLEADCITAVAEIRTLTLQDGSTVHLGPDSALAVDVQGGERLVHLLHGEAFFEVTPDPARPFIVQAGALRSTVLGTAFEVRRRADGTVVAVEHGVVRVEGPDGASAVAERLEGGHWLRYAPDRGTGWGTDRGSLPPDQVAAWRDRRIVARNRPLAEVIEDMRPFHADIIILTDRALGQRRVSGAYNMGDPLEALRAAVAAHGGVVRRVVPGLVLVSAG